MIFTAMLTLFLLVAPCIVKAQDQDHRAGVIILNELWRTDPDDEPYFRSLSHFLLHRGELFVLDSRSITLSAYSLKGNLLRSMDLGGEGPGELFGPVGLLPITDFTIGLMSVMGPRLVLVSTDGSPSYELGHSEMKCYTNSRDFSLAYTAECRAGKLYYSGEQSIDRRLYLARCDLSGFQEYIYMEWPLESSPGDLVLDESDAFVLSNKNWCTGSRERVYVAEERNGHDHYSIVVFEGDDELFSIRKPFVSRSRSDEEIKLLRDGPVGGAKGYDAFVSLGGKVKVDEYDPDVRELVEIEGTLWVRTSRSEDDPRGRTYDLFGLDGTFMGRRQLIMDGINWRKDDVHFLDEGYVVIVKGEYDALHPGADQEQDPLQFILARVGGRE